ncbi:MAG: TRAP transporter small permease [Acidobacteria bacterium]|nr:TRAP transporter small permease [Acidobacteriota bacterium]MDE2660952.1 TRAP transporter small permease [Acidobacteriota bacterium]
MDRSGAGTGALNNQRQRRDPLAIACSLLLAGIAVLCLVEVTLRYGFGGGLGFYDELAGFALVWLTFLGAVLARRDGAHIGIRDLVSRLSPCPRRIARILEHAAVLALHLVLAWFGTVLMLRFLGERSITMPIPMGAFYLVLPLFALLTAAMEARRLAALLRQPED